MRRFLSIVALATLASIGQANAQQRQISTIAQIALPELPVRSTDADQETLALQMAETLGFGCRDPEMWRWRFDEDDFPRAQAIVNAGERAFRDRGYAVALLPVEIDTVTAMRARLAGAAADTAPPHIKWAGGSAPRPAIPAA
ncbi:MAG: hypothetical protein ACT4N4_08035, partial [Rhodospirillales bacterium]